MIILHLFLELFQKILRIYVFLIIIRSLLTWISIGYHPILEWLYKIIDPYLNFIRRYVPSIGGLDFSPMVAILLLYLLEKILYIIIF